MKKKAPKLRLNATCVKTLKKVRYACVRVRLALRCAWAGHAALPPGLTPPARLPARPLAPPRARPTPKVFGAVVRIRDYDDHCPGAKYVEEHPQILETLFEGCAGPGAAPGPAKAC